jgi:hypothetical protein
VSLPGLQAKYPILFNQKLNRSSGDGKRILLLLYVFVALKKAKSSYRLKLFLRIAKASFIPFLCVC